MDILNGEKIKLRAIEPEDIDLIYKWENNTSVWRISNTLVPFSKYVLTKYIENPHLDIYQSKQLRLMIILKSDNDNLSENPIGTIELFDFDSYNLRAGIGILIYEPAFRQKGYASEALQLFIKYSFNILGLHQLYCNIATNNNISLNLFKKHGFKIIGEKKDWLKTPDGWLSELLLQLIND
ncbi:MAG: GNAT family N-acetyltransferase [Bacteroidales bacterium]|nr:GNAT family N-acetyltransferase [Bacteroidales bacterium]